MTRALLLLTLPGNVADTYKTMIAADFPDLALDVTGDPGEFNALIGKADILLTFGQMMRNLRLNLQGGTNIQWIQALGSGMDGLADQPGLRSETILTSMKGIHGPPVSEGVLAGMLAMARDIPQFVRNQDQRTWQRWPAKLLDGKTVGILGIGVIAESLAPKCKALGMRVLGFSSAPREVAGFDRVYRTDEFLQHAFELDHFVLLTPYSPATHHMIGAKVFAAMKSSAFFINLARGGVVDEGALLEALEQGKIAGAALDVFEEEPLPAASPLWGCKNVLITTHQGGFCDSYPQLAYPVIKHNMGCFLAGDLKGMVNLVTGAA